MSDGRANALPCPPLATPMHGGTVSSHTISSLIPLQDVGDVQLSFQDLADCTDCWHQRPTHRTMHPALTSDSQDYAPSIDIRLHSLFHINLHADHGQPHRVTQATQQIL